MYAALACFASYGCFFVYLLACSMACTVLVVRHRNEGTPHMTRPTYYVVCSSCPFAMLAPSTPHSLTKQQGCCRCSAAKCVAGPSPPTAFHSAIHLPPSAGIVSTCSTYVTQPWGFCVGATVYAKETPRAGSAMSYLAFAFQIEYWQA